jgi:hypothetical protein
MRVSLLSSFAPMIFVQRPDAACQVSFMLKRKIQGFRASIQGFGRFRALVDSAEIA